MRKEYHETQKVKELLETGVYVFKTRESQGLATRYDKVKFKNKYRKGLADLNLLIKYFDIQGNEKVIKKFQDVIFMGDD